MKVAIVRSYDDSTRLDGVPSPELVAKSEATEDGAVSACRYECDIWQYVPSYAVDHYRTHLHLTVVTVFVEIVEVT